jgi:hypothetical protein
MSRIQERREKILKYIEKYDQSPLVFRKYISSDKSDHFPSISGDYDEPVDNLVMNILDMSQRYGSFNRKTDSIETGNGRMRSSFDIWRHAKAVLPDIDIFSIMESIYRIKDDIYGHYCSQVHRAVFDNDHSWGPLDRGFLAREYGIMTTTWKKLHE